MGGPRDVLTIITKDCIYCSGKKGGVRGRPSPSSEALMKNTFVRNFWCCNGPNGLELFVLCYKNGNE